MANVTSELICEVLKSMPADMSQMKGDLRDIKVRVTATEEGLAGVNRKLDRIDDRLDRVGLVDH